MKRAYKPIALVLCVLAPAVLAQDRIELESIIIKGNKEFPQILYIVPWQEMTAKGHQKQTLVLHSLFGDLFEPVYEEAIDGDQPRQAPVR